MNLNLIRSVLKHKQDYVCLACLSKRTSNSHWQRPFQRAQSNNAITPKTSTSAAVARNDNIAQRRRAARRRKLRAQSLAAKTETTTAEAPRRDREPEKLEAKLRKDKLQGVEIEDVPPLNAKAYDKAKDTSASSKKLETAESDQLSQHLHSVKATSVKRKRKGNSKKKNGANTKVSKGPQVDRAKADESVNVETKGEKGTTSLEPSAEVSPSGSLGKVITKNVALVAAGQKLPPGTAVRRVATARENALNRKISRRLALKQRRQEVLERRKNPTTLLPSSDTFPSIESIGKPEETSSVMTTNTIRQALLGSAKVDKAAAKTTKTAVTQYRTEKEGRLADSTKKHAAKSTYKKNKEKAENVESEIKQKILKSDIKHINAHDYTISALDIQQPDVPRLSYGLERVLFNPGVYHLQDPRSRVYNFDPYLQSIMPVSEFDFTALKEYITSSQDRTLKEIAEEHGKRYVGSTSSMTGVLAHFHFLLSQWREINTKMMSRGFPDKLTSFTLIQRCPSAIFLRWKDGTYAIDADKEFATSNILSMLGKAMEKLLTLDTDKFERYRKSNPDQLSQTERIEPEAYHYSTMGDFLMRSQLDAYDPRLPGTGMFDLKTRAVVTIRMDTQNPQKGSDYEIKGRFGEYESFEREYFDMIRSAFLKYSLQVRMGRMDGIFVAFHNTERIFGFQYISLEEMDLTLHGQSDTTLGDQEFKLSLELLNQILDRATKEFPETSLRIHFETRDATTPFMYAFAEPVTEDEVNELQSRNQAKIEEFERELLGLHKDEEVVEEDNQWDDIKAKVEEAMKKDERGEQGPLQAAVPEDIGPSYEADEHEDVSISAEVDKIVTADVDNELRGTVEDNRDENEVDGGHDGISDTQNLEEINDTGRYSEDSEEEIHLDSDAKPPGEDEATHKAAINQEGQGGHAAGEDLGKLLNDLSITQASSGMSKDFEEGTPIQPGGYPTHLDEPPDSNQNLDSDLSPDNSSTADTNFLNILTAEQASSVSSTRPPILAMTLTIRNKVDGKFVLRPENITSPQPPPTPDPTLPAATSKSSSPTPKHGWSIEYTLTDLQNADRAWTLYQACQARRKQKLEPGEIDGEDERAQWYVQRMRELNLKGKKWREDLEREESGKKAVVLDSPEEAI